MRSIFTTLALITVGVTASYTPAVIPWATDLDCTACIRGGYDFCIEGSMTEGNKWYCLQEPKSPEYVMPTGGLNNGYVCSNALADQMNAIINGCRPFIGDAAHRGVCGDYIIDLTDASLSTRVIQKFPVGTSCTYRAISKCGYPAAVANVKTSAYAGDFNVAYATKENLDAADELNGWEFYTTMDWTGSYQTSEGSNDFKMITDGMSKPKVADLNKCNLKTQNLYVTITRTKQSPAPTEEQFLSENARQLQALTPDFSIGFSTTQGNAKFLGAISFAFAALLAVFAF